MNKNKTKFNAKLLSLLMVFCMVITMIPTVAFATDVSHTITFDSNGGTGTMLNDTENHGENYILPECTFTPPAGKVFSHWVETEYSGKCYPKNSYLCNRDLTFRAEWEDEGKLLGWVKIDGTLAVSEELTATIKNSNITGKTVNYKWERVLGDDSRIEVGTNSPNYTLVEADATERIVVTVTSTMLTGKIESAISEKIEALPDQMFTVSFDGNGGTGTMAPVKVKNGEKYILPHNSGFNNVGKTFAGWYAYGSLNGVGKTITVTSNMWIKAGWRDSSEVAELTANIDIEGMGNVGESLTAHLIQTNNTGELTYTWKREEDILQSSNSNTYLIKEADLGKEITLELTSSIETGTVIKTAVSQVFSKIAFTQQPTLSADKESIIVAATGADASVLKYQWCYSYSSEPGSSHIKIGEAAPSNTSITHTDIINIAGISIGNECYIYCIAYGAQPDDEFAISDTLHVYIRNNDLVLAEREELNSVSATLTGYTVGKPISGLSITSGDSTKYDVKISKIEYYDSACTDDHVFKSTEGLAYRVFIEFSPKDGYCFKYDATINVNGVSFNPSNEGNSDVDSLMTWQNLNPEPAELTMHTITATTGVNGTISPEGSISIADGNSETFTFTPDSGYEIDTVTVDDSPVSVTGNSYTLSNITKNTKVHVTFKKIHIPTPTPPTVIEGDNQTMTGESSNDIIFKIDADFTEFDRLEYNGATLDTANYTAVSGSIIITLKGDYVKTLPVGTHTFTAIVGEFNVPMSLIVEDVKKPDVTPNPEPTPDTNTPDTNTPDTNTPDTNTPETGDNSNAWLFIVLAVLSLGGIGFAVLKRKTIK